MKQVFDIQKTWVACLEDLVHHQIDRTLDFSRKTATPPFLLRRWVYGSARQRYGELFEYQALSGAYEKFHACSDAVLHYNQYGLKEHALQILEDELPVHSENVQASVVRLYAETTKKK
ncbi:MAG: hypothetical protein LBB65_02340 [Burkholderiales bacterium]|nr:hypothetical protein [Burkholderiales bacterium]